MTFLFHRKLHFLCRKASGAECIGDEGNEKRKEIEAFCILLIVTLMLIFVRILYQPGTESERGEFQQWMVQLKDGKKTKLKLPCFVTADKDGQIILYNDMLSEADKGKILSDPEEYRISWKSA